LNAGGTHSETVPENLTDNLDPDGTSDRKHAFGILIEILNLPSTSEFA
jgi:hypothetical protein